MQGLAAAQGCIVGAFERTLSVFAAVNEAKGFGYRDGRLERGAVEHLDGQGILVEVMQAVQVDRNGFLAALVGAVCE